MMRVRFLREAGGLGDVVRCLGVVSAVSEALPGCETWFYGLRGYIDLARICPDVDRVVDVAYDERRARQATPNPVKHGYLARHPGPWDATVDMFCPPFQHEVETLGDVRLDRIDAWTAEAAKTLGVRLRPRLATLDPGADRVGWADGWLWAIGARGRDAASPLVGFQPLSVDPRRSLSSEQTRRVLDLLGAAGVRVLTMHGRQSGIRDHEKPVLRALREAHTPMFVAPDLPLLVAMVSRCDAMLTCDSSLIHVAAALDKPAAALFGITRGDIICKHYPSAVAVDAGPRERSGLPCPGGRACYGFFDPETRKSRCGGACPALQRVPVDAAVKAVVEAL